MSVNAIIACLTNIVPSVLYTEYFQNDGMFFFYMCAATIGTKLSRSRTDVEK
jgi:hypothetical protein